MTAAAQVPASRCRFSSAQLRWPTVRTGRESAASNLRRRRSSKGPAMPKARSAGISPPATVMKADIPQAIAITYLATTAMMPAISDFQSR